MHITKGVERCRDNSGIHRLTQRNQANVILKATTPDPLMLDAGSLRDPLRLGRLLRSEAPMRRVTTSRGFPGWLATRHDDCSAALRHPQLLEDAKRATVVLGLRRDDLVGSPHPATVLLESHMLNSDPPRHARLRSLVGRSLTEQYARQLRSHVAETADVLLDRVSRLAPGTGIDLIESFARPLSADVVRTMLGMPAADVGALVEWTRTIVASVPGEELTRAATEAVSYVDGLIASKRERPTEDLMSELVHVSAEGDRLTRDELATIALLLIGASHDTTIRFIGNAVLALLSDPEHTGSLRADPELLPRAVEELTYHDGFANMAQHRIAARPLELGGVLVQEGETVVVSLLTVDRGAGRADTGTSGMGLHHCLGTPLARLEACIAVERLITRFEGLRAAAPPEELRHSVSERGPESLLVRIG
ncbi:cytochrome P450 [Streptomyces sp. NPDC087226]|jgi:cytochrome P450|uniref:cytochrome P450 n=1 Tax=Streptomyces sp. NPDC087226 TaxID=3365771 RepID=UPI00382A5B5E